MKRRLILASLLFPLNAFAQGSLTPPAGAPTPTMKSLAEIANDTSTAATNTTVIKNAVANQKLITTTGGTYQIFQPGTYLLTSDRTSPSGAASISVLASNVTIDLNGFTITASDSTSRGISTTSNITDLIIRNGTIRGCNTAIDNNLVGNSGLTVEKISALDCTGQVFACSPDSTISDCVIRGTTGTIAGISCGSNSTVRNTRFSQIPGFGVSSFPDAISISDCMFNGVTGSSVSAGDGSSIRRTTVIGGQGLKTGAASSIEHSVVKGCSGGSGTVPIRVGADSRIESCVSSQNSSTTNFLFGIELGPRSLAINCTASSNSSSFATLSQQTGGGFYLGDGCQIQNCTASGNVGAGIHVAGNNCTVLNNTVANNGSASGVGAGISVQGTRNRIEGNNASGNVTGILLSVSASKNFVVRNTAGGNTSNNWNLPAGNFVAPVVSAATTAAFTGNTGGTALGSTDPAANFTLP